LGSTWGGGGSARSEWSGLAVSHAAASPAGQKPERCWGTNTPPQLIHLL